MGPKEVTKKVSSRLPTSKNGEAGGQEGDSEKEIDFSSLTIAQLKEKMRERGMASPQLKARKADLVARLLEEERLKKKKKRKRERERAPQEVVEEEEVRETTTRQGEPKKLLLESADDKCKGTDVDMGNGSKEEVIWLVESREFWAGGEPAFKKKLAFTTRESALQGAKVAFVNMNCFYDLVNSKELKGRLPPEGKVLGTNRGITFEAIRDDGVGGRVEVKEVALDVKSSVHDSRAQFLEKWT